MKALISENKVIQLEASEFEVHSSLTWMDAPVGCEIGWVLNGGVLEAPTAATPTMDEIKAQYTDALMDLFNTKASERDYESQYTILSFLSSTNTTWAQEAADFNAWRDSAWAYAIQVFTDVQNEVISLPTLADFLAGVPTLTWT